MKSHDFLWTHSCDGGQLLSLLFTAVMCKSWQTLSIHSICTSFMLQFQSQVNIISQQWISPSSWYQLPSRAFSGWMLQSLSVASFLVIFPNLTPVPGSFWLPMYSRNQFLFSLEPSPDLYPWPGLPCRGFLQRGERLPTPTVSATAHLPKALQCVLCRDKPSALLVWSCEAPSWTQVSLPGGGCPLEESVWTWWKMATSSLSQNHLRCCNCKGFTAGFF